MDIYLFKTVVFFMFLLIYSDKTYSSIDAFVPIQVCSFFKFIFFKKKQTKLQT